MFLHQNYKNLKGQITPKPKYMHFISPAGHYIYMSLSDLSGAYRHTSAILDSEVRQHDLDKPHTELQ